MSDPRRLTPLPVYGAPDSLRVLFVTSECTPFAMTGGLGDVSASLPIALRRRGLAPSIVMPLYRSVPRRDLVPSGKTASVQIGSSRVAAPLWQGALRDGVPVYFVEHDGYFDRDGLYGPNDEAYSDNLERFSFFCRAALEASRVLDLRPEVIHANDWPTSLLPLHARSKEFQGDFGNVATVLTVHNIGYQGISPLDQFPRTGLGIEELHAGSMEHFGTLNLLKAGLAASTLVTTVSPRYAREVQQGAFGCGLDGVMRSRASDVFGILNGIDADEWNPKTDRFLAARYDENDLSGKAHCKADLQQAAGFEVRAEVPLLGLVTRLSWQKGMDVFAHALRGLLELDVQVVLLGKGDHGVEDFFRRVTQQRPDRFHAWIGFDHPLAHRIEAGADFFVMPSRYEPCGLNQMYSMRYGALPIVRASGGLDDTVDNYDETTGRGTGFKLDDLNPSSLFDVIGWAVSTWYNRPGDIKKMRARGMRKDFSWDGAADRYETVYRTAMGRMPWSVQQERRTGTAG